MKELVKFENQKSFVGKFNGTRPDKHLKFASELAHFEGQIKSSQDKALINCTHDSFQTCLLEAATLGLSWNKRMGYAYPVRYGQQCTLMIGYQGLTHLVNKAGTIKSVQAEVVCENDPIFEHWVDEKGSHIKHQISRSKRGKVTHAYCIAHYKNGGYHIEVMGEDDLAKVQKAAKTQYVWNAWIGEMSKKSVIRRAWKHWPKDEGGIIESAITAMDKTEPMNFSEAPVEQAPQYITITDDQEMELHSLVADHYHEETDAGKIASKWMEMLCEAMGIKTLTQMPADRFDDAVEKINLRLSKVTK
jgi:phage RecT family recombinase